MAGEDRNTMKGAVPSNGILDGKKFVGPNREKGKKSPS
jgi:hypothetical protein